MSIAIRALTIVDIKLFNLLLLKKIVPVITIPLLSWLFHLLESLSNFFLNSYVLSNQHVEIAYLNSLSIELVVFWKLSVTQSYVFKLIVWTKAIYDLISKKFLAFGVTPIDLVSRIFVVLNLFFYYFSEHISFAMFNPRKVSKYLLKTKWFCSAGVHLSLSIVLLSQSWHR